MMCNSNITMVMGGLLGAVMSLENKPVKKNEKIETKEKE